MTVLFIVNVSHMIYAEFVDRSQPPLTEFHTDSFQTNLFMLTCWESTGSPLKWLLDLSVVVLIQSHVSRRPLSSALGAYSKPRSLHTKNQTACSSVEVFQS